MKKILLKSVSVVLAVTLLTTQSFGIYARTSSQASPVLDESVFSYDEGTLTAELIQLNALDAYVDANVGVTLADLSKAGSDLVANMDSNASPMGMGGQDDGPPLGIPSFLWGCVFGIVGLLIVYLMTDNNKVETKKALWGCVASSVISVVLYGVLYASWFTAASSTY